MAQLEVKLKTFNNDVQTTISLVIIHKIFGHHPKMQLLWLWTLLSTCLFSIWTKTMLSLQHWINSTSYFRSFMSEYSCLLYIEFSIMRTHLCHHHRKKLLILIPPFQYERILHLHYFLWFSYFHIMTISSAYTTNLPASFTFFGWKNDKTLRQQRLAHCLRT